MNQDSRVRAENTTADEACERLVHQPPSAIQSRLEAVLEEHQALSDLPQQLEQLSAAGGAGEIGWRQDPGLERLKTPVQGWLAWRQHQGIIDRRPVTFYGQIWSIFHHTAGLVIGNKLDRRNRLNSSTILSDMTQGEQAFVLLVEHMLNNVKAPEYRHPVFRYRGAGIALRFAFLDGPAGARIGAAEILRVLTWQSQYLLAVLPSGSHINAAGPAPPGADRICLFNHPRRHNQ